MLVKKTAAFVKNSLKANTLIIEYIARLEIIVIIQVNT